MSPSNTNIESVKPVHEATKRSCRDNETELRPKKRRVQRRGSVVASLLQMTPLAEEAFVTHPIKLVDVACNKNPDFSSTHNNDRQIRGHYDLTPVSLSEAQQEISKAIRHSSVSNGTKQEECHLKTEQRAQLESSSFSAVAETNEAIPVT